MNNKRGRPSLGNEGNPTVKVSYYFTEQLLGKIKEASHNHGVKDSDVVRSVLDKFLHLYGSEGRDDRITLFLEQTDIGRAASKAAAIWGTTVEAIIKMALLRGLGEITKEGEALKKGLNK